MEQVTEPDRKPAKVGTCLIIEDSAFDQAKLRRVLDRSFKQVHIAIASTLGEARKHMSKYETSLILLDNNLPDGKGANFALELASNPRFAGIPIIMVSDWPSPFMYDKAINAGVKHVVNKADFGARFIHSALRLERPIQQAS